MKTISLDAMGGDHGPKVVVPAALKVLRAHPDLHVIFVGMSDVLNPILAKQGADVAERWEIHHATQQVAMDELPSQALRSKKDSSMRVSIDLVKAGRAQACVSAGNTGALMATARFVLKMLPGIDRPAIIASIPAYKTGGVRVLDLGANVDSTPEHLFQFAAMGSILAAAVDNIERPTVALLSNGEEEIKGNELVKQTAELLAQHKAINYVGYVEGDAVFSGDVDVVVCDGFVGNVTLKVTEGVAKLIRKYTIEAFKRNWLTRLAVIPAIPVLKGLIKRIDPRRLNGATFLGINGIVLKSHGGAGIVAFTAAIEEAVREIEQNIPERIRRELTEVLASNSVKQEDENNR